MAERSWRLSLLKKVLTSKGTTALTSSVWSLAASSSIRRNKERLKERMSRTIPVPTQRGHTWPLVSPREGRKRWRDISSRPKREIRPT